MRTCFKPQPHNSQLILSKLFSGPEKTYSYTIIIIIIFSAGKQAPKTWAKIALTT